MSIPERLTPVAATAPARRLRGLVLPLAVVLTSVLCLSLLFAQEFASWNRRVQDALFRLRQERGHTLPVHPDLVFIDIDDASYEKAGNIWFGRKSHAALTRAMDELGVKAALFDIAFAGATEPDADAELLDALRTYKAAYIPLVVAVDPPGSAAFAPASEPLSPPDAPWLLPPPLDDWGGIPRALRLVGNLDGLERAAKGVGHITCYPDRDGVFRRMNLVVRDGNRAIPSLALRAALDLSGLRVGSDSLAAGEGLTLVSPQGRKLRIPIDHEGNAVLNWIGPWNASFPHFSAYQLLESQRDPALRDRLAEALEGAVAVVADTSTRSQDFGITPLEKIYPKGGLHLTMLNGLLTGSFLRELGYGAALLLSLAAAGGLLAAGAFGGPLVIVGTALATLGLLGAGAAVLFLQAGLLVPVMETIFFVVAGTATVLGCRFLWLEQDRALLRHCFESYLPAPVLDKVLRSPDLLSNVQRKKLSILFSDISGFTRWCSTQSPSAIRATLNEYFGEMTAVVFEHGGTVDKYIGDGLMVFFGDPVDQPDHAERAVRCAVEMQRKSRALARKWSAVGGLDLHIRVGVNTGEVAVGNMGSSSRMDYTVLGAEVNLSQRLEANAPVDSVLVSRATYEAVAGAVPLLPHGEIRVKGYDEPIQTYEVDWSALETPLENS